MPKRPPLTARNSDRHALYEQSVQEVAAEIDFVDRVFRKLRSRRATRLREDFCGTANTSCEWIRRRRTNVAVGVDRDAGVLAWGRSHNVARLTPDGRGRITLMNADVRNPGPRGRRMDAVLAMNFSYFVFKTRADLRGYFRSVRRSLVRDGVFFLDFAGGYESMKELKETTRVRSYRYIWEHARYNPLTGDLTCHIHFKFADGSMLRRAFTYHWRLWTMPEIKEVLAEAGFRRVTTYCEGDDGKSGGNGVFRPARKCPADASFLTYVVAEG